VNPWQYRLYRLYRKAHMVLFGLKPGGFIQDPVNTFMGDNVQLSHGTQIYTCNHRIDNPVLMDDVEPVDIGDDCWLGANVIVLPGVKLGKHTIVGAGSVVTKSFEDGFCVIAGVPARVIRRI